MSYLYSIPAARRRLLRIKSRLDLQVVKKYQCKRTGKQKVVISLAPRSFDAALLFCGCLLPPEAGGRDLYATSVYPVQLGLKAALTSG